MIQCDLDFYDRVPQIVELDFALELIWHICLNNGASRISKAERYQKSGEVMEGPRRDGRPGILRSQLTITPEGHVHIRCADCSSSSVCCRGGA